MKILQFPYYPVTFIQHAFQSLNLSHLRYSVCIRQEEGFCCVQYMACPEFADSMTIDTMGKASMQAQQDSVCTFDYIGISGLA